MKENDWIVANMNNPEFTVTDFKNVAGFSLDNTLLLPFDEYLKYNLITSNPLFLNDLGVFDKNKFKTFYDEKASKFGDFQKTDIDNYLYGFWDVFKKPTSRVRNPEFKLEAVANPTHLSLGVTGLWAQGPRTKSDFELAEKSKIFDWEKGTFKDSSPEDFALFSNPFKFIGNLFSEPLVLAKYEEDTDEVDPFTGQMVHHKKGENKVNEYGDYYFETLGGRSLIGKQVLSVGDVLTKEDTAINKYDFFDSDDLEKSPEGVIAKNLAAIAPMLLGGPTSTIYAGLYVGREILKTLPMLERMSQILIGTDYESPMLSTLAAYGQKFTGGTSDYAKSKAFSFENFGNMISDVALLWGQQKFIADAWSKISSGNNELVKLAETKAASEYAKLSRNILNRANKGELAEETAQRLAGVGSIGEVETALTSGEWKLSAVGQKALQNTINSMLDDFVKNQKLGLDLSLIYMSLISNTDVYESALEHGATKREAAVVALGSTLGMFGVDKYLGLGEMFFDDEGAAQRRLFRKTLKDVYDKDVKGIVESVGKSATTETAKDTRNGLLKIMDSAKRKTKEFLEGYRIQAKDRALSLFAKSVGEGLEETSEELVTDLSKSLYELAGQFGWASQKDIGAWDNMGERYAMSFFGGAIGGAMYGGIDMLKHPKTAADADARDTLLTIVRQGNTGKLIDTLEEMRKEGSLGDKNLSIDTIKDSSGDRVFLTADDKHISQNDFNFNQMKTAILLMDKIINGNQLGLSDDQLFERMLLSDMKLMSLLGALKDTLKDASYMSGYYKDFLKLVSDIYDNEVQLDDLRTKTTDEAKRNSEEYKEKEAELLKRREELNLRKEEFFKNKSLYYLLKTMFAMNTALSGMFLPPTLEDFTQYKYKKPYEDLSENLKELAKKEYDEYVKNLKVLDIDLAFDSFLKMLNAVIPTLNDLKSEDIEAWEKLKEDIHDNLPKFVALPFDLKIEALEINIEEALENLHIIKSEEYDKPWKDDPFKKNKAFKLLLEENPDLYFELVKDTNFENTEENGEWSIHFKTGNGKENHTDLTLDLKQRLFKAASLIIPEGAKLSTWGFLTKGGVSGINRFKDFSEFRLVGTRKVKLRAGQEQEAIGDIDTSLVPTNELLEEKGEIEILMPILRDKDGNTRNLPIKYSLKDGVLSVSINDSENPFLISKDIIADKNIKHENRNEDFSNLSLYGKLTAITLKDGEWTTTVDFDGTEITFDSLLAPNLVTTEDTEEDNLLIIGTTWNAEKDIEIPILQKITSESDEEFENRNLIREGETEEEFNKRVELRKNIITNRYIDNIFDQIQSLLKTSTSIDPSTYRYILASIGLRLKDLINISVTKFKNSIKSKNDSGINPIIQRLTEIMDTLLEDLSNSEEIWNLMATVIEDYIREDFLEVINAKNVPISYSESSTILKDSQGISNGYNLLDYILNLREYVNLYHFDPLILELINGSSIPPMMAKTIDLANLELILKNQGIDNIEEFLTSVKVLAASTGRSEVEILSEKFLGISEDIYTYSKYETIDESGANINIGSTSIEDLSPITIADIYLQLKTELNTPNGDFFEPIMYSEEYINKESEKVVNEIKGIFDATLNSLKRDKRYKGLAELQKKLSTTEQPIVKFIKSIAENLGEDFTDIESTLSFIYDLYNNFPEAADFVLNDKLKEALNKALMLLDMASAAIIAASSEDSYSFPWPFNKTINEWNKAHKSEIDGDIEDLPELDKDMQNITLSSIGLYQTEIKTWLSRAERNQENKVKEFKEFEIKFEEVKLKFWIEIGDGWITEDGINLLEGVAKKDNPKDQVLEYERTFYKNVTKLLKEGKTLQYIFDTIKDSINWKLAALLKTSKLDKNLEDLNDYDKFVYILTCLSLNPDEFYSEYKNYVELFKDTIAPLSPLKYAIRIVKALEKNKSYFNEFMQLFKKEAEIKQVFLENTSFISGIAGSGKSSVIANFFINENSWVGGPTQTQVTSLQNIGYKKGLKDLKGFNRKELLKYLFNDLYDEAKDSLKDVEEKDTSSGGKADISNIKINKITNPPKNIILDECTLFSNAELLAISKWCLENNVHLILLGDENQKSNSKPGRNIQRETSLMVRTPKQYISLREDNCWKTYNLKTLSNLEDSLREADSENETEAAQKQLISNLKKFNFKYFFDGNTFTGDMIQEEITEDHLKSLKGKIKFVGSINSPLYLKLKALNKEVELYLTIDDILGSEEDYVVCDINWNELLEDIKTDPFKLLDFTLSLYTIITRSRKGTLIKNNGLNKILKLGKTESYSTNSIMVGSEAIKEFSKMELDWLNSLNLNIEEEEKSEEEIPPVITVKKDEPIEIKIEDDEAEVEETEKIRSEENKKFNRDSFTFPEDIKMPIQIYTNFNFLGVQRDEASHEWIGNGSNRDIGIFLEEGKKVSTALEKREITNKLLDLKSAILSGNIDFKWETLSEKHEELAEKFTLEAIEQTKFYIVKEEYDPQIHHFITLENGLLEGVEKTIYTLQARITDKNGNVNIVTLGVLPTVNNLHPEITADQIKNKIKVLEKEGGKELEISNLNESLKIFEDPNKALVYYNEELARIGDERRISKPYFTNFVRFSRVRTTTKDGRTVYYKLRINEIPLLDDDGKKVGSFERFRTNYVISNEVFTYEDKNNPIAGKPFVLITADRSYSPGDLLLIYKLLKDGDMTVRRLILDPAGTSLESLIYKKQLYFTPGSNIDFNFPFETLPMAMRMYTALHNFRANLGNFINKLQETFNTEKDTTSKWIENLNKILKVEADLHYDYVINKESLNFKEYCKAHLGEKSSEVTIDQLLSVWDFNNELDRLKLKQFRLGYDIYYEKDPKHYHNYGVYERKSEDGIMRNYINPEVAILYYSVINSTFTNILNPLFPLEEDNEDLNLSVIDYRLSKENLEKNAQSWVDKLDSDKLPSITLTINDDETNTIEYTVPNKERLKSLPIVLCKSIKYLQLYLRSENREEYLLNVKHNIRLDKDKKSPSYARYDLIVSEAGLGENPVEDSNIPGIVKIEGSEEDKVLDRRILNMFNVAFHGTANIFLDDDLNKSHIHADEVIFPKGFFSDAILGGKRNEDSDIRVIATDSSLFLTDLVPSGLITYIDMSEIEEVNPDELEEEEEIIKDDEETKTEELLNKINDSYPSLKLTMNKLKSHYDGDLNQYLLERISRIIDALLTNDGSLENPENVVILISIENDEVKITTLEDFLKSKGYTNIKNIFISDKNLEIELDNNSKVMCYYQPSELDINNKFRFESIVKREDPTENKLEYPIKDIVNNIKLLNRGLYRKLKNLIEKVENNGEIISSVKNKQEFIDAINDWFNRYQEDDSDPSELSDEEIEVINSDNLNLESCII